MIHDDETVLLSIVYIKYAAGLSNLLIEYIKLPPSKSETNITSHIQSKTNIASHIHIF